MTLVPFHGPSVSLQELMRTVDMDLQRLHPGDEFYSAKPVQASGPEKRPFWTVHCALLK